MYSAEKLAENIISLRKARRLTQGELAERLFVTAQSVSKWETGASQPDLSNICALCTVFGVSADELLGIGDAINEKLLIGIDGGGTKTEFVAFTEQGNIVKRIVLDGSNPNTVGLERCCSVLKSGIDILSSNGKVSGVFAGVAGLGNTKNRDFVLKFLNKTYPDIKMDCQTDIMNVIGCQPEILDCAVAICGTGSVVYGYSGGELHRVGGWGYLLEGAGSGFDIGAAAVKVALGERDGVLPHSILTELVEKRLSGTAWDSIDLIYKNEPSFLASFAPLVFEAAALGDGAAVDILKQNAAHIAELVTAVFRRYNLPKILVISGSIVSRDTALVELLQDALGKAWKITVPTVPQIFGASVQCCRLCGLEVESIAENFKREYKKVMKENA